MTPRDTMHDFGNHALCDSVLTGQCGLSFAVGKASTNGTNGVISKLRRTSFTDSRVCTSLCLHVTHVISGCAKKQMCGIAARWIVAAMADHQAVRNGANKVGVGKSVSKVALPLNLGLTVPIELTSTSPRPTFNETNGLIDERKEAISNRTVCGILVRHRSLPSVTRHGLFQQLRGFLMPQIIPHLPLQGGNSFAL
jgi:hypothetical protein